ncbi:MAG: NAD(P)-dependent oxidoreductase [Pirellulaceae bacterium]|nr:NAD(P)-dependent oxidoreductase [Pirellulaceae bacterium]
MKQCIIFGGTGYIGRSVAMRLQATQRFQRIWLVDLHPPAVPMPDGISFIRHDAREPISAKSLGIEGAVDWILNFAAVHRERGHHASEYFRTNIPSTRHIASYADSIGCQNIFFTSSIAVYGPTSQATDENSPLEPTTPYGVSKLCCELILEAWKADAKSKRLVVVRPGVIYGHGDPGNIGRLIQAIKRGRFAFPGRRDIRKSYGYIEGLIDSIEFMLDRPDPHLIYNYVEKETLPLSEVAKTIAELVNVSEPKFSIPIGFLASTASAIQLMTAGKSPIHPVRVRKAATQTWIVPQRLIDLEFHFRYDFRSSLEHWREIAPQEFSKSR